jgi:trans-2,3-dihydro-3-hydroxyanthranilate isomerase
MSNRGTAKNGAKRRLAFVQLDVFTNKALEGNQLAVFPDAEGLSTKQMQDLAREMNFCETTFVLPRNSGTGKNSAVKVRIFTVAEELPFAGHPTLGTAYLLRKPRQSEVVLDLKAGKIPVKFEEVNGTVFGEMTQRQPEIGSLHDKAALAQACGIPLEEVDPDLPIQTVSTGMGFAIVPLRSLGAIGKLNFSFGQIAPYLKKTDAKFLYFVTRQTRDRKARLHARMIFYNGEDPATGSAAGCCAAWMVAHGVAKPDERVMIEQGVEMRRPSQIFVRAGREGDRVVNVRVGGYVVEVARGEVRL